jgi:N-acetylglucosaminyldiphosphoundecaprenol N-acetyl-beta-D-mannosaminyltransferase
MIRKLYKKDRKQGYILGVKIDSTQATQVLRKIRQNLTIRHKFYLVTPNPEIVLIAQKDPEFAKILNEADFSVPDGIGLSMAHKFLAASSPALRFFRVPVYLIQGLVVGTIGLLSKNWLHQEIRTIKGRELFMELIKLGNQLGWSIVFVGGEEGIAVKAKENIEKNYKRIKIDALSGPIMNNDGIPVSLNDKQSEKAMIERINKFAPDILFVGFGAPKQEKWIFKNLPILKVGGAMAIGGTLDYVSGKVSTPPNQLNKFGLEWLWRLVTQKGRVKRIINATIFFPLAVFKSKFE